jgi:hypothetical protein
MQKIGRLPRLLLSGALLFLSAWVVAGEALYSPQNLPKAKAGAEQCVEPVDVMRREHMLMIKHQRDATMHQGIRTTKYSLVECINCHVTANADGSYPSVNTDQHFCSGCHAYAAVDIDCFQCHASKPEGAAHE